MSDNFDDPYYDDFEDEDYKSKSQVKREMHALQELGEQLTALSASTLDDLGLPDNLRTAIADYQRFTSRQAQKRQRQYIGKVMRSIDPEPIQQALDKIKSRDRQQVAFLHRLENWRDRLLSEGDSALGELLQEAPNIDRQQLRQLIRNAKQEAAKNKPPKSSRAIFQLLKASMASEEE